MFLPLRDPLVATFNESRAPTSRKYVAEQGIVIPNWLKTFQTIWSHSSAFALEKQSKNLNFQSVFTSKRPFGGYFNETHALTSSKSEFAQDMSFPKSTEKYKFLRSHSSVFVWE